MAERIENRRKRTPDEISSFCAQVAMMLSSGMALYDGMEALARAHADSALKEPYERISAKVTETGSLYTALKECGGWPSYMVEMVGIGESTGRMEEIMNGLSTYYRREGNIKRAVSSAVAYPVVLGIMMLLIILVMIIKVIPVFRGVLGGMGVELTDSGSLMMNLGLNIGWIVLAVVGVMVLATLICVLAMRTGGRDKLLAGLKRIFVPLRRISMRMSSSRVASVLSMMLSGGFPLDEALKMVPSVLDDAMARERIEQLRKSVEGGSSMSDAITQTGMFDELHNCMIRTACEAGCADTVMARVAEDYEEQVDASIANMVSIIEPTLVGVLSVVIGLILLSVMLPMVGIISSIL